VLDTDQRRCCHRVTRTEVVQVSAEFDAKAGQPLTELLGNSSTVPPPPAGQRTWTDRSTAVVPS
jgi:hypothetical protein